MPPSQSSVEGTPFGRYQLLKKIATGGMAEIFLAKQQGPGRFERRLVIKRILPHMAQDPKFVAMFLDEAALAAQLSHPNIAQVYDFGEEQGHYFLALELVRGPDLRRVISACNKVGSPPPVDLALRLASQVLSALDYAHHALDERGRPLNLVHRDVSPQNILVSFDGVVKLIDFGIAKAAGATHETEAGFIKGKFAYMAPEQLRALPLDGRCDLYATGLLLYELLTLTPALKGSGPAAIADAIDARIRPIALMRPDLPEAIVHSIDRALQCDREDRQRDCREFLGELDAALVGRGVTVALHEIALFLKGLEEAYGSPLTAVGGASSGLRMAEAALAAEPGPPGSSERATKEVPTLDVAAEGSRTAVTTIRPAEEARTALRPKPAAVIPPTELEKEEAPVRSRRGKGGLTAVAAALLVAAFGWAFWSWQMQGATAPRPTAPKVASPVRPPPTPPQVLAQASVVHPAPIALAPPPVVAAATVAPIAVAPPSPPPLAAPPTPAAAQAAPAPVVATPPTPPPARPTPPRLEPSRASLSVDCFPQAKVAIDGREVGNTPIAKVSLPAGPHTFMVSNAKLGFSRSVELKLKAGETRRERLHFAEGQLILFVKPWANVTVAGHSLGRTPLAPQTLYEGSYAVHLENPELHLVVDRQVTVQPGQPTILKIDFTQG